MSWVFTRIYSSLLRNLLKMCIACVVGFSVFFWFANETHFRGNTHAHHFSVTCWNILKWSLRNMRQSSQFFFLGFVDVFKTTPVSRMLLWNMQGTKYLYSCLAKKYTQTNVHICQQCFPQNSYQTIFANFNENCLLL